MIIDRKTARLKSQTFFYTGKECKRKHIDFRYVCSGVCIACAKIDQAQYRNNPEKRQAKVAREKLYYAANREKMLARTKQWKIDNPERHQQKYRKYHGSTHGRAKSLFKSAQTRASQRGYEFSIDLEWIMAKLETGKCDLTGIPFVMDTRRHEHRNPYSPSLDRRDNSRGYTKENCRIILWALNMGFADWGQETYLKIARALIGYDL